jgi:hypothetical protein
MGTELIFGGAIVNGREFPFIRITVSAHSKITNKFHKTIRQVVADTLFPSGFRKREWKRVRSVAYVKDWRWKWLRIIPKELRIKNLDLEIAGGLKADFFGYWREKVKAHDEPLNLLNPSPTENNSTKSET